VRLTKFPTIIIFDVDGVLVDVRGSFQKTTLETVEFFTGRKVAPAELHAWKNKSGYNDDWKLSAAWVRRLGGEAEFEEVKRKFVELYWGANRDGNVRNEKWLLKPAVAQELSRRAELAIFTGRTREELDYTMDRCACRAFWRHIVTVEDVKLPKPDAEGLRKILGNRDPAEALYIGDNIDDALAAQVVDIPFVGVLPRTGEERRQRAACLGELRALTILSNINGLASWLRSCATRSGPRPSIP
jgi:HAD superfamily hydrolase (TIGR01548 family)